MTYCKNTSFTDGGVGIRGWIGLQQKRSKRFQSFYCSGTLPQAGKHKNMFNSQSNVKLGIYSYLPGPR